LKVRDLLKQLKGLENYTVLISSDEELNTLFKKLQVAELKGRPKTIVVYGLSGSEVSHVV